jgi:glycosyltransferase involved in cell wall biosynthesis
MTTRFSEGSHVVINGWFLGQATTGSGQYLAHLVAHLPRQAPDVRWSLLAPLRSGFDPTTGDFPGVEIHPHPLPGWPKHLAKLWWEQVQVPYLAHKMRADLLWTPYWAAPLWQPAPVVVTIHDLIPVLLPAYRGGWLQRRYTDLVSYTARRAAAVITVSQASARDVTAHLHIPPERIHVVHHGPNQSGAPNLDAATLAAVRTKFQLPDRFFLYLGGFDRRKNVPAVLAAYRRYLDKGGDPAVRLVIAGQLPTADTSFTPHPQRIAAELGLHEQVQFCGWVDDLEKAALYALATAYLFPSLYEGFGMMVLEAMTAGAPVVTSSQ